MQSKDNQAQAGSGITDALVEILTRRGIIEKPSTAHCAGKDSKNNRQKFAYHNTELLLKNYRKIKKFIQYSERKTLSIFRKEFNINLNVYLEYGSSKIQDFSDSKTKREASKYDHYYALIWHLEKSVAALPELDCKGAIYKCLIVETYFRKHDNVQDILTSLSDHGIRTLKTYYDYRNKAISILGRMMWGFADREFLEYDFT